jgi:hypothetical protein
MHLAKSAKFGVPVPPDMLKTIETGLKEMDQTADADSSSRTSELQEGIKKNERV